MFTILCIFQKIYFFIANRINQAVIKIVSYFKYVFFNFFLTLCSNKIFKRKVNKGFNF